MDTKELLQQALLYLNEFCALGWSKLEPLCEEIEAELAKKPEAEAVGRVLSIDPVTRNAMIDLKWIQNGHLPNLDTGDELYTSPCPMQRLTEEEIQNIRVDGYHQFAGLSFANAIMDAMIEKNK